MKPGAPSLQSSRLLDQVRERIRYAHYSLKTDKAYHYWIRFFILWSATQPGGMRHPREMRLADVETFLSMLANARKVSASTHKQALSALLFLYREVLGIDLPWLNNIGRPQRFVSALQPNRDPPLPHPRLGLPYGVFPIVKDAGSQHRIGAALLDAICQVVQVAHAARCDDGHGHRVAHCAGERQVKAGFGAVAVHAGEQYFAGAQLRHLHGPGHGAQAYVFAATMAEHIPAGAYGQAFFTHPLLFFR